MSLYKRFRDFVRSHDSSTPERPRRDGTYGWPKQDRRMKVDPVSRAIEPIFDADLNLIGRPKS